MDKHSIHKNCPVYESNFMGIAFWNINGDIADANDAFLKIVGYSKKDLNNGKISWEKMTPPEYAHLDKNGIQEIKDRGYCSPFEKEYIRKDGTRVPILIAGASIGDEGVGITYVIDITDRVNQKEKLDQTLKRLADITENMNLWVWECDTEGNITYSSAAIKKILGYNPEEVLKMNNRDLLTDEDRKKYSKMINDIHRKYKSWKNIESNKRHKDGHSILCRSSGVPFYNSDGECLGFRGTMEDISEAKKKESAIAKSEEKYSKLFHNANAGIAFVEVESMRFTDVNETACRMLGYSKEEILNLKVKDIHPKESIKEVLEIFEAQARGEVSVAERIPFLKKNGDIIYCNLSASTIELDGKIYNTGHIVDITDKIEAEENLIKQKAALEVVLSNIASDRKKITDEVIRKIDSELKDSLEFLKSKVSQKNSKYIETIINKIINIEKEYGVTEKISSKLSFRENEVAALVKQGYKSSEIAKKLGIKKNTVETIRRNIRKKLGIKGKADNLRNFL